MGGGPEDRVPGMGRHREAEGRNKRGWREEKGDVEGLTEAPPHPSSKCNPCPSCFSIWPQALAIWPHPPPHGACSHLSRPLLPLPEALSVAAQDWGLQGH